MPRLLATAAALGLLLGSTGAFAQASQPVYSPGDPGYYGQPQYAPYANAPPPYQGWSGPGDGNHSTGTAGRAYPGGQKSN
jgi:opacity protein-like surface antigen